MNQKKALNEWCEQVYNTAKEKGWYDGEPRKDAEILMLIVSEIAEALEEIRGSKPDYYEIEGKPEGASVELADAVIRIMDFFQFKGWDLESVIAKKNSYNQTRPYRHGNKKL